MHRLSVLVLLVVLSVVSFAQTKHADKPDNSAKSPEQVEADRVFKEQLDNADVIYQQNKYMDALPLFEELYKQRPENLMVLERLSFALSASEATIADQQKKKEVDIRALELLKKA